MVSLSRVGYYSNLGLHKLFINDILLIVHSFAETKEPSVTFLYLSKLFLSSLNISRGKLNETFESMKISFSSFI